MGFKCHHIIITHFKHEAESVMCHDFTGMMGKNKLLLLISAIVSSNSYSPPGCELFLHTSYSNNPVATLFSEATMSSKAESLEKVVGI